MLGKEVCLESGTSELKALLITRHSLAAAEMRLVISKMIWNFDMELHPDTQADWFDQKVFTLWEKPPFYVQLKPVVRD